MFEILQFKKMFFLFNASLFSFSLLRNSYYNKSEHDDIYLALIANERKGKRERKKKLNKYVLSIKTYRREAEIK